MYPKQIGCYSFIDERFLKNEPPNLPTENTSVKPTEECAQYFQTAPETVNLVHKVGTNLATVNNHIGKSATNIPDKHRMAEPEKDQEAYLQRPSSYSTTIANVSFDHLEYEILIHMLLESSFELPGVHVHSRMYLRKQWRYRRK